MERGDYFLRTLPPPEEPRELPEEPRETDPELRDEEPRETPLDPLDFPDEDEPTRARPALVEEPDDRPVDGLKAVPLEDGRE